MSNGIRLTIQAILEGKVAARPQIVGIMQVIPLLPQDDAHHNRLFAVPTESMYLSGNPEYGIVLVENKDTSQPLIIPSHTTWITKHRAQDHAMCKAGLLAGGVTTQFDNAACVQSSQPGAIPSALHQFQILPATLRRMDRELAEQQGFNKLWPSIEALNSIMGVPQGGGHLEVLFRQFEKELLEFVAEFEMLPNQIGALIVLNGKLVGIEIAPSPEYWKAVWEPLIRYCYGPEAILTAKRLGEEGFRQAALERPRLDSARVRSLEDLEAALGELRNREREKAQEIVRKHLGTDLDFTKDHEVAVSDRSGDVTNYKLCSSYGEFIGQVVIDDDYVVYASLVSGTQAPKRPLRRLFEFLTGD